MLADARAALATRRLTPVGTTAAAGGVVSALLVFVLVHDALIDDAYITLTYARNVAFHAHWGLISSSISNTATSPLNVLVLAAVTFITRQPVVAAGVVFAATSGLVGWWTARTAAHAGWSAHWAPVLVLGMLLSNPLLLSTVGLETYLGIALLTGLVHFSVTGRPVPAGVVCGLLVLTRLDLVIFCVIAAIGVRALRRRLLLVTGIAFLVAVPWFATSWFVLGSAIPDTFVFKTTANPAWGHWDVGNGWFLYFQAYPLATILSSIGPALGAVLPLFSRRRLGLTAPLVLGLGGVVYYLVYGYVLQVAPYHWYYGPSVGALVILAGYCASAARSWLPAASAVAIAVVGTGFALSRGVPWRVAPITTNWALSSQYAAVAAHLEGRVRSPGEVGALAFFCDCEMVDPLSDRGRMIPFIDRAIAQAGPVKSWLLQINYWNLDRVEPIPVQTRLKYRSGHHADGFNVTSPWRGKGNLIVVPVD